MNIIYRKLGKKSAFLKYKMKYKALHQWKMVLRARV